MSNARRRFAASRVETRRLPCRSSSCRPSAQQELVVARCERQIGEHLRKIHGAAVEGARCRFAAVVCSGTQLNEQADGPPRCADPRARTSDDRAPYRSRRAGRRRDRRATRCETRYSPPSVSQLDPSESSGIRAADASRARHHCARSRRSPPASETPAAGSRARRPGAAHGARCSEPRDAGASREPDPQPPACGHAAPFAAQVRTSSRNSSRGIGGGVRSPPGSQAHLISGSSVM